MNTETAAQQLVFLVMIFLHISLGLGSKELRKSIYILECKIKVDFQLYMLNHGSFDGF